MNRGGLDGFRLEVNQSQGMLSLVFAVTNENPARTAADRDSESEVGLAGALVALEDSRKPWRVRPGGSERRANSQVIRLFKTGPPLRPLVTPPPSLP